MAGTKKRKSVKNLQGVRKKPRLSRSNATVANRWVAPGMRIAQEKKTIDLAAFTDTVTGGTPALYLLNGVATGDDFTNRDGRRIMMSSLFLRWSVNTFTPPGIVASHQGGNFRLAIVYDKQSNGVAPVYADVFAGNGAIDNINLNNRSRFQILYHEIVNVGAVNTTNNTFASPSNHFREKYLPLNLDVQYNGTGATIASIATGSMYLVYQSDVATGAGGSVVFKVSTRVRFADF